MEENQNVLCTVERIEGTTVFVIIESGEQGAIVVSEIAPGRIRNLRDYVFPGKKIVCKVIGIHGNNINLSLRRVSEKEKKEVMQRFEQEKSSISILKTVVSEKAVELAKTIKNTEKSSVYDFLQYCKTAPEKLEKYLKKDEAARVCQILKEKKEKQVEVKKEFALSSGLQSGISSIKKILLPYKNNITYLAAARFLVRVSGEDYKKANLEMQKILSEVESQAKKEGFKFELK